MSSPTDAAAQPGFQPSQVPQIRDQVDKIAASSGFANSQRKTQLLRYLVDAALEGRGGEVNEYAIGQDVFERPVSFDPRIDSTVRAEVSRLRSRLKEYYAGEGQTDPVLIDLGSRGYSASFKFRESEHAGVSPPQTAIEARTRPAVHWRWVALAAALVLVLAGVLIALRYRRGSADPIRSLVVLPFANLSGNPQNEYLADGLTEELTNELAQWQDLRVVARTSAFQFKGKGVDVREVGRRLGVDAVLEGSIERQGDRLRVTAQFNRASNGFHIWSRQFEARSADSMAVQDEIARAIAAAIRGNRVALPQVAGATANPEAHDLSMQGSYQWSLQTADSLRKALALFQAALAKDPGYGQVYVAIARTHISLLHVTAESPEEAMPRAREALEKAIDLDPHNAEAHGELADIVYSWDWNWPRAELEFRDAIRDGARAPTHSYYGWALATRGRFEESHQQSRIAEDLDPLGSGARFNEAMAYMFERKYDKATGLLRGILDLRPNALDAHLILGAIGAAAHDCKMADANFEWSARALRAPVTTLGLGFASACNGQTNTARKYFEEAASGAGSGFVSPYQLAMGYAYVGDKNRALAYLEKSAAAKEQQILYIRFDAAFDSLRSDPRFLALETKLGLL
jgi:TolB-like protein/TolA-binding protein